MKKPKYMEEMLKIILYWLGVGFVIAGLLSFTGLLAPTENSAVQSVAGVGTVFLLFGAACIVLGIILKIIVSFKNKTQEELRASGTRREGTVEGVYLQTYTQYGKQSPYRICYTYTDQGKVYHGKSCLLWEIPDLAEGDPITVYTNDAGKSMVL